MIKDILEFFKIRLQKTWEGEDKFEISYNDINDKIYDANFLDILKKELANSESKNSSNDNLTIKTKVFFVYEDDDEHNYFIGIDATIDNYRRKFKTLDEVKDYLKVIAKELSEDLWKMVDYEFERTEFNILDKAKFNFYCDIKREE